MRFIILLLLLFSFSSGGAKVQEYTLENGVKLIIKETKGRGIVSGVIFIKSGTHGEYKRGLTNLTATLLTKGTKSYDAYQVASAFEDYGGSIYASTGDDYVEIGFSTKVDGLEKGLKVIKSMLLEPLFSQEDLERERQNALQAIKSRRERGHELAMDALRRLTYRGSNYQVVPLGLEEDIKAISREDVIKRWHEVLKSRNMVVALVGDFKGEEVLPLLKEVFSAIPEGAYWINPTDVPMKEDLLERVKRPGSQATVFCAFDAPEFRGEEYFAFKVLDSVLGDGMTSKLFKELREKRGYAYAVYSTYPTRLASPRLIAYIGTSPEKREDALRDMVEVVKKADIKPEDVELAKNKIIGDFLLAHQTRARQAWYLGFFEVMGFGWKADEEYPERIKAVRFEDVQKLREKYLKIHHCVVVEP
ncbi:MAG: M16 family metallopeptidase [Aquificaceae bacterium]|uniref:M16 family metallopeptidase n=1 Tax=Hydrogenobacter sp. Uz 6-8 TaxID=3384828 RepID=UPI0030B2B51C